MSVGARIDDMRITPELPTDPAEPPSVIAGCGHDVYAGEHVYHYEDGRPPICPDCFADRLRAMLGRGQYGLDELAEYMTVNYEEAIL